jgi:hypothetical protein
MGTESSASPWFCLVLAVLVAGCGAAPNRSAVKPNEPWVYLHLIGQRDALLQRKMDDDWIDICRVPCKGAIPATGHFRLVANEPGRPFTLPGATGSTVTLRAEADGSAHTLDSTETLR